MIPTFCGLEHVYHEYAAFAQTKNHCAVQENHELMLQEQETPPILALAKEDPRTKRLT